MKVFWVGNLMSLLISAGTDMSSNGLILIGALALFSMGCATPPASVQAKTPAAPEVASEPVVEAPKVVEVQAGTPSQMSDEERAVRIKDILQLFDQMTPRFEACYQESDKDWGGQVILQLRLDPSGNLVEQGWDEMPNETLRTCVEKVVQSQWFGTPAPTERLSLGFGFDAESGLVARLTSKDFFSLVIWKNRYQIQKCYERSIKRTDWQGRVAVRFSVAELGALQSIVVESSGDNKLKTCINEVLNSFDWGTTGEVHIDVIKNFIFEVQY